MVGDAPRRPHYEVYISQFIRVARVNDHEDYFYARNKCLTVNFSNRVIGVISLGRLFPTSIADSMN